MPLSISCSYSDFCRILTLAKPVNIVSVSRLFICVMVLWLRKCWLFKSFGRTSSFLTFFKLVLRIWSSTSLQSQLRVTIMPYSSQQLIQLQACWSIKNFSGSCVFFVMMKYMDVYPQYRYFMSFHKTSETMLHAMCSQWFWHPYVSNFLFLYFIATSCPIFLSPEIQHLGRTIGYVLDVSGNLDTSLGLFINPHSPKVVRSTAKSTKFQSMATVVDIR